MRASDRDRDAVAERLRVAAGEGRITLDELEERLEGAYAARTYGELDRLIDDLPFARTAPPEARPLVLETRSGSIKHAGKWVVPERITARVTMGSITIDFTQAVCRHREVLLEAACGSGSILIIVPHDWGAVIDGLTTGMGHVTNKASTPVGTGVATVLRVTGKVGMGHIKIKRPRR